MAGICSSQTLMRKVAIAATIIIAVFILIGDITIAFFILLTSLLQTSFKKVHHSLLTKKLKKRKKKRTVSFSYFHKLKYFGIGMVFSFLFLSLPISAYVIVHSLPSPTTLSQDNIPQTTKIYDRNHVLLYQIYANQNRTVVKLSDIPLTLRDATIAIEDKNFYKDPGFDIVAIVRAAVADLEGKSLQGASTITQQLVKTAMLTPQRTLSRKLEEAILSFWAEHIYTKDQILQMYLNQVAYGGTAWGVEAASQTYFGKDVKDLDLAESAFLAGMPQAPTLYSPYGANPMLWKQRQKEVLHRMLTLHFITQKQEQDALSEQLVFQTPQTPILAPHFVMYIKDLLIQKYGLAMVEKGGLSVTTTLDLKTQNMAQQVVADEVAKDGYLNLTNGAALVTNPQNGDILVMVGSHDYNDPNGGAVNVTTSYRQPGSSIKLVTYAAALSHGFTAASLIDDEPVSYPMGDGTLYQPVNYDGRWHGNVTLRVAFANSINIPAVKALQAVGIPTFVSLGRQMGITSLQDPSHYGLSVTLGSPDVTMLDMATAYGTVANSGQRVDLNPLLLVKDAHGNILEQKGYLAGDQVLDPGVTYILASILSDNAARSMEFGPASPLYLPDHTAAVKTGTTNSFRDNWTIGFTPPIQNKQYVVTVWVGNNDNSPMNYIASGITGAAPIWHQIMENLLKGVPNIAFSQPSDIVARPCDGHTEYFLKGTENSVFCHLAAAPITPTPTAQPVAAVHIDSGSQQNQTNIQ